jgi:lipopolysaccharide transport protein LptA
VALRTYLLPAQIALFGVTVALFKTQWKSSTPEMPAEKAFLQKVPAPPAKALAIDPAILEQLSSPTAEAAPAEDPSEKMLNEILARSEPPPDQPLPLTDPMAPSILSGDPVDVAAYQITAEAVSRFDMKQKSVIFSGNVELHNQRFHLKSAKLSVVMDQAQGKMKSMIANGSVEVDVVDADPAKTFRGTATQAQFDPVTGLITLSGFPRIVTQGREHRAASADTQMLLFTQKPHLVTKGRATTIIQGGALPGPGTTLAER